MKINLDDLTLGQMKEITSLSNNKQTQTKTIYDGYIGEYVICRSRNEGVNFGLVLAADSTGVQLSASRRLWYHKPVNKNVSLLPVI